MSRRSRTNINSNLFLSENISSEKRTRYIIKGKNDGVEIDDDKITVNKGDKPFYIQRNSLRATLNGLKEYAIVPVSSLSSENTEDLRNVVEAMQLLHGDTEAYNAVLEDINNIFADITTIIPGTVGAFFIGCFKDEKFQGNLGCSPKCAASSLKPAMGIPE